MGTGTADGLRDRLELYAQGRPAVGLGLVGSGVTLGAVGVALLAWSETAAAGSRAFWQLREFAVVAAALALPVALLGVLVVVTGRPRALVGLAGFGACALDTVAFARAYPADWNLLGAPDATLEVAAVYVLGVALLVVAVWLGARAAAGAAPTHPVAPTTPKEEYGGFRFGFGGGDDEGDD